MHSEARIDLSLFLIFEDFDPRRSYKIVLDYSNARFITTPSRCLVTNTTYAHAWKTLSRTESWRCCLTCHSRSDILESLREKCWKWTTVEFRHGTGTCTSITSSTNGLRNLRSLISMTTWRFVWTFFLNEIIQFDEKWFPFSLMFPFVHQFSQGSLATGYCFLKQYPLLLGRRGGVQYTSPSFFFQVFNSYV